jgi:hypothetical protein
MLIVDNFMAPVGLLRCLLHLLNFFSFEPHSMTLSTLTDLLQ